MSRSENPSFSVNRLSVQVPPGPAHPPTPSIRPVLSTTTMSVELLSSKMSKARLNWPMESLKARSKFSRKYASLSSSSPPPKSG